MRFSAASKQPGKHLTITQMRWLLVSVILAIAPHWRSVPAWFWPVAGLVLLWRAVLIDRPLPRWQVLSVTLLVLAAIGFSIRHGLGQETGITILASMAVLKTLETHSRRDAWVLLVLSFFLVMTRFFYGQDLVLLPWFVVTVLVITYTVLILEQGQAGHQFLSGHTLWQAARYLLLAFPLAMVFFLLFPRLASPIWGSPEMFGSAKTGLGNSMSPGSIAKLFMDDSPAMRVNFTSPRPASEWLYWRGPVLEQFDGTTWRAVDSMVPRSPPLPVNPQAIVSYRVELEPHGQHFLPVLDYPVSVPKDAFLMPDLHVSQAQPVNRVRHYRARSQTVNPLPESMPPRRLRHLLAVPRDLNPKTRRLVSQWQAETSDPLALAQRILHWFNQENFIYTFSPPPLQGNTVDEFLFRTRAGFCEHYASAFTVMMRMAGVPARVVTGYQGGLDNGDYWLVRQSDAHAWSEIWLQGKGWLRVDPTTAVAPSRVQSSARGWLAESRHWYDYGWLQRIRLSMDNWRYRWNHWVRSYDAQAQNNFLQSLGLDNTRPWTIAWLIAAALFLSALLAALGLDWRRQRKKQLASERIYHQVERRLRQAGVPRLSYEGPADYLDRVIGHWPALKAPAKEFARRYEQARYAAGARRLQETHPAIRVLRTTARRLLADLESELEARGKS